MYKYRILKYFIFSFILVISAKHLYSQIYDGYLLVDHTAVQQFNQIPDEWLEKAKMLTLHYGTTSHGSQLLAGVKYLEENIDAVKYSVVYLNFEPDPPRLPDQESPPALRISAQGSHPDDYWDGLAGMTRTRNAANTGFFNYSMFSFCGQLASEPLEYVQAYLDSLDKLEKEYPHMRFIYMTDHSDGNPAWSKLNASNTLVRQYCKDNNKILYDFTDIENHDPAGNYYPDMTDACEWAVDWCSQHPEDCVNVPDACDDGTPDVCCAHSHGFNCVIKGRALWWMMSRLSGWEGVTDTIPPEIPTNLIATAISDTSIIIKWEPAQDNVGVNGYNIYRDELKIASSSDTSYIDSDLKPLTTYEYKVSSYDIGGNESLKSNPDTATTQKSLLGIGKSKIINDFQVFYNYPNPFNPSTTIHFNIPFNMKVRIDVFSPNGEYIKMLLNADLHKGYHSVLWNGKNFHGNNVGSGSYIYRIIANDHIKTNKMILMK